MRSSTSSSERTHCGSGFPWAVVVAACLVALVEVAVHLTPTRSLLGYGEGLGTYYEVRHTIEDKGAAEVSVLGESRGRESIVMPDLDKLSEGRLGREIYTANYSCPDAKSTDMLLVTREMMSARTKPKLVVYVISSRGLLGDDHSVQREEVFGVFPNEYGHGTAQKLASFSEYPLWQVRNALQRHYYTFRYRYRFRNVFASVPRHRAMLSPVQGEETTWQRYMPNRSLATNPISDAHIQDYVARLLDADGKYVMGQTRVEALREIVALCARNGVKLAFVAAPISDDLNRHLPAGTQERFREIVRNVANEGGVPFLTPEDLGLSFDRSDFREQSHLNRRGAEKVTKAVVDQVVVPALGPAGGGAVGQVPTSGGSTS